MWRRDKKIQAPVQDKSRNPLSDAVLKTQKVYQTPQGAAAYRKKEAKNASVRASRVYDILGDLSLEGLRVLDVGCGFGRDVLAFRARGAEAYGIDASEALMEDAQNQHPDWFAQADILSQDPFPFQGPFDMVWSSCVLVHVPRTHLSHVLCKMWSSLKEGGFLMLTTKMGQGEKIFSNLGDGLERVMVYYMPEDILSVLQPLGAVPEEIQDAGTLPTGDELLTMRLRKKGIA